MFEALGSPKQSTEFRSGSFLLFGWLRDGTQLAVARGMETDDLVQMKGFRLP